MPSGDELFGELMPVQLRMSGDMRVIIVAYGAVDFTEDLRTVELAN